MKGKTEKPMMPEHHKEMEKGGHKPMMPMPRGVPPKEMPHKGPMKKGK